jgi:L-histidine N-alpha-methyltransferase
MWQFPGLTPLYRGIAVVAYRSVRHPRSNPIPLPSRQSRSQRLQLISRDSSGPRTSFADEVRRGLTSDAKNLPCRFLYDRHGSQLFEQICELPEYYPTRAERSILEKRSDEVAEHFNVPPSLVELGSGSAAKTRLVIESLLSHHDKLTFVPIDISSTMLEASAEALLADYPGLDIQAVAGEYEAGLRWLRRGIPSPRLILWLGSSVGNLDRDSAARFLASVAHSLDPQDRLLLGIDLRKSAHVLENAYDDDSGVTARFNLNLLTRINRELGADFPVKNFTHRANYLEEAGRVEMHLVSERACRVQIPGCGGLVVEFEAGESIHTENSHKYSASEIDVLVSLAGLATQARWLDVDELFSLNLLSPA